MGTFSSLCSHGWRLESFYSFTSGSAAAGVGAPAVASAVAAVKLQEEVNASPASRAALPEMKTNHQFSKVVMIGIQMGSKIKMGMKVRKIAGASAPLAVVT